MTAPIAITVTWASGDGASSTTGVAAAAISSRGGPAPVSGPW